MISTMAKKRRSAGQLVPARHHLAAVAFLPLIESGHGPQRPASENFSRLRAVEPDRALALLAVRLDVADDAADVVIVWQMGERIELAIRRPAGKAQPVIAAQVDLVSRSIEQAHYAALPRIRSVHRSSGPSNRSASEGLGSAAMARMVVVRRLSLASAVAALLSAASARTACFSMVLYRALISFTCET